MRGSGTRVTVRPVNIDRSEKVVLDLDPGEPIHGRITISTGPTQPFHGWLDLTSKLEQARALAGTTGIAESYPDDRGIPVK
jgi:hypothetical protein